MLFLCRADVVDDGPTLKQHWLNASCMLGNKVLEDYLALDSQLVHMTLVPNSKSLTHITYCHNIFFSQIDLERVLSFFNFRYC